MRIIGLGAQRLVIDASGNDWTPDENNGDGSRVFRIDDGIISNLLHVSISGLTLTGGDVGDDAADGDGGAIYSLESVTVSNCTIHGNSANSGGGISSGKIYVGGGNLTVIGSTISSNSTRGAAGFGSAGGGGIVNLHGQVMVSGSTISGNSTLGYGGGIRGIGFGSVAVTNSLLSGNSAPRGGGVYCVDLTVSNSMISGNSAGWGGGIWGNRTTVTNSTISGNTAFDRELPNYPGRGGGVVGSTVMVVDSTISGNATNSNSNYTSNGVGGGIDCSTLNGLTVIRSTITGNSARSGGGIYSFGSVLVDTIVAGNIVGPYEARNDLRGSVKAAVFSLVGVDEGWVVENVGSLIGTYLEPIDPLLGPLVYNGGPTFMDGSGMLTHALQPGSPALDVGDPAAEGVPGFDQRGEPWMRIVGGRIDMGAVESQANPLPGDYNFDQSVDAADYTVWRNTVGSDDDLRADGSGATFGVPDGEVDELDYEFWRANYGNTLVVGGGGIGQGAGSGEQGVVEAHTVATQELDGAALVSVGNITRLGSADFGKLSRAGASPSQRNVRLGVERHSGDDALVAWLASRDVEASAADAISDDGPDDNRAEGESTELAVELAFAELDCGL